MNRWPLACYGCCLLILSLACLPVSQAQESEQKFEITATLEQLYGAEQAEKFRDIQKPDATITWQVYKPNHSGDRPPGLLVYVSPTRSGVMDHRWAKVLDEYNLVYIAADRSGNRVPVTRRMVMATSSIYAAGRHLEIDEKRIYVSGFSGGGRVASFLSRQYPTVFSGGIFICGVDFWNEDVIRDMERVLSNRYVFVTGTRDFNLNETRIVYNKYLKAGAKNSLLEIESGMSHELPNAQTLANALDFLDRR
jgi:pimeloyl-ACP methyl ester carboxylesterase